MDKYANFKQIAQLDKIAVEQAEMTILQMMEMAGNKFALGVKDYLIHLNDKTILVLSGPGHNGGDGLSAARFLHNWGAKIIIVLVKPDVKPDTAAHLRILKKMGLKIEISPSKLHKCDLIIDALLGYNQQGNPKTPFAKLIKLANSSDVPIFAFDNPTGINIESGNAGRPTILANTTITLAIIKKGLITDNAHKYVGNIFLADLGIPRWVYKKSGLIYPFKNLGKNYYI